MKSKLMSDHREIDELLAQLLLAFELGNVGTVFKKLDLFWARLAMHIRAEHLQLFPAILEASKTKPPPGKITHETVIETIDQLHEDHDFFMRELASAIKIMREINPHSMDETKKQFLEVQNKVSAVAEKLKIHNEIEETKVYRWTVDLMVPAECWVLGKQIQEELDNIPPRFKKH